MAPQTTSLAERFADAVRTLIDDGPIKQRLSRAYAEHLGEIDEAELPAALRNSFLELRAALNRVSPAGKESRVKASVQKMSFIEARKHAGTIHDLHLGLLGQTERAEPLKVVNSRSRREPSVAKPPRYLTTGS
jgi:hypothetical protein